jgi:hypothetical protein
MDTNLLRVAPKCWDIGLPVCIVAHLADEHTYSSDKRVHEKRVLGIEVPYLIYVPRVELRCTVGLLGSHC